MNKRTKLLLLFSWPFFGVFQMELQDDGITMGLEHSLSKDIISIINNVFQAPWGGSHTCQKDEKAIECNLCQSSILCYQLACELLERLAPKEESRLVVSTWRNWMAPVWQQQRRSSWCNGSFSRMILCSMLGYTWDFVKRKFFCFFHQLGLLERKMRWSSVQENSWVRILES